MIDVFEIVICPYSIPSYFTSFVHFHTIHLLVVASVRILLMIQLNTGLLLSVIAKKLRTGVVEFDT